MQVQAKHGKVTQNMHGARRNYRYVWDVSVISINIDIMGDLWKLYHKLRWKLKVLDYLTIRSHTKS